MRTILFNQRAKKYLKKHPRKRRFVTYEKSENILLLFESDGSNNEQIKNIVKTLQNDRKNVVALGFSSAKQLVESDLLEIKLFNKKSIDFFQKPEKAIFNKIKSTKFDLLIDLSEDTLIPLMYISLLCDATMKISTKIIEPQLFDFILNVKHQNNKKSNEKSTINEQFIFDEIIFYLKSIQTTD